VNRVLGLGDTTETAPTVILDHVLLGSGENAADRELLCSSGITHICNCAVEVKNHYEGEFVYMKLHIRDAKDEELIPLFQTVTSFLRRTEEIRGRALIHCIAGASLVCLAVYKLDADTGVVVLMATLGASRSPALLIAYLMIDKKMPLLKAYSLVRNQRRVVRPNQSFRLQLAKYEVLQWRSASLGVREHD
jgi:protein-tyrosine phosphatase